MLLAATCALAALAVLAAPAQALQLGLEEPHSPNAESISTAYWVMIALSTFLIVAINAVLIIAAVRFRERRGREASRFSAGRGALRPVVGVLSLLALAIFIFGVVITADVREVEPSGPEGLSAQPTAQVGVKGLPGAGTVETTEAISDDAPTAASPGESAPLEINAIAQQWIWRFEYPGHQPSSPAFSYGELVVPVDTAVVLNISSTDTLHSWWVPSLGGQVQASPNDVSQTWFKADEVGRYPGRSTMFSGSAYPVMRSWVNVVEVTEYQDYVRQLADDLSAAQEIVATEQEKEAAE